MTGEEGSVPFPVGSGEPKKKHSCNNCNKQQTNHDVLTTHRLAYLCRQCETSTHLEVATSER